MGDSNRNGFFGIVFVVFIAPFIWDVVAPENDSVLINDKGNIITLSKKIYVIFDSDGFYKRQHKIITKLILKVEKSDTVVTRHQIDMKRIDLEFSEDYSKEFEQDYKLPTIAEKIARIPNDKIAKMILEDRLKEQNELLKKYKQILSHIVLKLKK